MPEAIDMKIIYICIKMSVYPQIAMLIQYTHMFKVHAG